jgi:hypothetical protein
MKVRQLSFDDELPDELLNTGLPVLDPHWCWVAADESDKPFAIAVTSFVHGVLFFWRILSVSPLPSDASPQWLLVLLRAVQENARVRGCVAMVSFLEDKTHAERRFLSILKRAGGGSLPFHGSMAAAPLGR